MANYNSMYGLPFTNGVVNTILDDQQNNYEKHKYIYSTNNDMLDNIDPDINNINPNSLNSQCKYYNTSLEFNKTIAYDNNISILHTNICSSINKLNDFMYYINNLDTTFHFIGLSETWATANNKDMLNIPGYSHEQCVRSNNKRGGALASTFIIRYNIKKG